MNEQYEIIRGRKYRYDPDFDAFYSVYEPESTVSKWAWIPLVALLALVCYYVEFLT